MTDIAEPQTAGAPPAAPAHGVTLTENAAQKVGSLLSQDVPARIGAELLEREDWTEVQHPGGSSSEKKGGDS